MELINVNKFLILILVIPLFSFSQSKKETIYLLFDGSSKKKCIVEDGKGNNLKINYYKKDFKKGKKIFSICDEVFLFNPKKQKKDTCNINYLKKLNLKSLEYVKDKYQKGKDFKHHLFKRINIIEKISKHKIVKYYNVYWCCEWSIE